MSGTRKILGSAVITAFCMAAAGLSDDPPLAEKDRPVRDVVQRTQRVPQTVGQWADGARLFEGLGNFHRRSATSSPEAQSDFDQGMRFLWAFNHDEATRSFAKAAELDPQCAMCYWGVSLTVGRNYNLPRMAEPRARVAWEALQQAEKYSAATAPVEQALIAALAKRYQSREALNPSNDGPIATAYAQAMKAVAQQFPDDADVQTITAEAMMNINA